LVRVIQLSHGLPKQADIVAVYDVSGHQQIP
jgi:hypothetical protein